MRVLPFSTREYRAILGDSLFCQEDEERLGKYLWKSEMCVFVERGTRRAFGPAEMKTSRRFGKGPGNESIAGDEREAGIRQVSTGPTHGCLFSQAMR